MSNLKLTKEECIDIIEFIDFFYTDNLIATAELRKEKPKEVQEEDARNLKSKLSVLQQLIEEHFESSECRVESSLTREKNLVSNLVSEIDKLEKALTLACEDIADVFGNCPLDQFDCFTEKCERCDDNPTECYKEYYMSEVFGDENIC